MEKMYDAQTTHDSKQKEVINQMIDNLNIIVNEYYQNIDTYKKMEADVEEIINTVIDVHHIKISNISFRVKSEEALRNKVISKGKYHHLDEITDILGCRIITLFEGDVEKIFDYLGEAFEICEIVDKRKKNRQNRIEFGYNSLHLIVRFTDSRCQLVEYQKYQDIRFEIQIRTVLQHAWAEVEHGLGYKSYYEPPMEVKRKLNRLSGALEILDEEFENIRYDITLYNQSIDKVERIFKTDINKESLIIYSDKSDVIHEILHAVADAHHYALTEDINFFSQQHLPSKLYSFGYQYIHELNDDIIRCKPAVIAIGEELSNRINYDVTTLNRYSPVLWFSFIPPLRPLLSEKDNISDEELNNMIIEAFRKTNGSLIEALWHERT